MFYCTHSRIFSHAFWVFFFKQVICRLPPFPRYGNTTAKCCGQKGKKCFGNECCRSTIVQWSESDQSLFFSEGPATSLQGRSHCKPFMVITLAQSWTNLIQSCNQFITLIAVWGRDERGGIKTVIWCYWWNFKIDAHTLEWHSVTAPPPPAANRVAPLCHASAWNKRHRHLTSSSIRAF